MTTPDPDGRSREQYLHGHHDSVLRSHRWRTAENSAAYLLDRLRPGYALLDVGSGPGTITLGLAERVLPGRVVGVDSAPAAVEAARHAAADRGLPVEFGLGDAYALEFADHSFDVVHAHQVLQHLADPVAALGEMRRVTRPGGWVAVRDADYEAMVWHPAAPGLSAWSDLYRRVARAGGGEPDAGRRLKAWALVAGFTEVICSASVWCFAEPEDLAWWSGTWAERVTSSAMADQALARGEADADELAALADAWRDWGRQPDAWFVVPHGEVLARA